MERPSAISQKTCLGRVYPSPRDRGGMVQPKEPRKKAAAVVMDCRGFLFGAPAVGRQNGRRTAGKEAEFMRRGRNRWVSLLLALVLLLGLLPGTAWAAEEGVTITFVASSSTEGFYVPRKEMTVYPGTAQKYGYSNGSEVQPGEATILDALVQAHVDKYGETFTKGNEEARKEYLDVSASGFVTVAFKNTDASYSIQLVNGGALGSDTVNTAVLEKGDVVENLYPYVDPSEFNYGMDIYAYFAYQGSPVTEIIVQENEPLTLTLMGDTAYKKVMPSYYGPYEPEVLSTVYGMVYPVNSDGSLGDANAEVKDGTATFTLSDSGDYTFTVQGLDEYSYPITLPWITIHAVEDGEDHTAQNLAANLTWETIRGENLRMNAVSSNLNLPETFMGKAITWDCDDESGALVISGGTGYVSVPLAEDLEVSLTAELTDSGLPVKMFPLVIKAEGITEDKVGVTSYSDMLTGIAENYTDYDVNTSPIDETDLPWVILDLAAYGGQELSSSSGELRIYNQSKDMEQAKYVLSEYVRNETENVEAGIDSLKSQDLGSYYIYSAPYVLLALDAVGVADSELTECTNTRESLIDKIADYLIDSSSYLDVDLLGMTLPALARYNTEDYPQVQTAVEKGITWLSDQQGQDGTWNSNANSTAMAVVALSALGIDAHTDSRFIKNDTSAVEGLLSFALADHSGFGYKGNVTYNAMATEQGFRALVAYARMKEKDGAYNIYLEAKNSKDAESPVPAPDISATSSNPGGGGTDRPDTEVEIDVSVMVPPKGGAEGQYTYRHDRSEYTDLLGGGATVTVSAGTTALSVLQSVLREADIDYTVSGGYVSQIGGLEEGDHGPNSGWQYLVDGSAPTESASTYTFQEDAEMVWYYTDDYTREESGEQWSGSGGGEEPAVEAGEDGTYQVAVPQGHSGPAAVEIPEARPGQLVVIVHEDGTEEVLKKALAEEGTVYLLLEEDARIRIVAYENDFQDVPEGSWYAAAVDFAAGRGLLAGVSETEFAPEEGLSRGMLVTTLYALEDPGEQSWVSLFDDVAGGAWYARGTVWAAQAGIVSGYGDGTFGPEDPITREELAVMLYAYAGHLGLETTGQAELSGFADSGSVSPWAAQAVAWAVDAGILGGKDGDLLDPAGGATRAEAAAMLRALVAWMLCGQ